MTTTTDTGAGAMTEQHRVSIGCSFANRYPRHNQKSTMGLHHQCPGEDAVFPQGYGDCWCWCHLAATCKEGGLT